MNECECAFKQYIDIQVYIIVVSIATQCNTRHLEDSFSDE